MNSFFIYIFQVSLVFSGFYLLYILLFSKLTFHAVNRSVLLLLLPLSLVLPFSQDWFPALQQFTVEIPFITEFTTLSNSATLTEEIHVASTSTINYSFWLLVIYTIGVLFCLIRFARTTFRLIQLKTNAEKVDVHGVTVYVSDIPEVFSYFHWIFIPKTETVPFDELIITHEKAHVQQKHSVDVLLAELFIAFCWFHPLAYWYRKSLKSVHEFQADAFVLHQNIKKSTYLELLLQSIEPKNTNPTYSYFSHPTLKKRIEMITKSQSKNRLKLTYILLIPMIALVFMAFRATDIDTSVHPEFSQEEAFTNDNPSIPPILKKDMKRISSVFGVKRKHPKLKNAQKHSGIDIVATAGTPVMATADGVVVKAKLEGNWGNLIVITHANGFETWYAHLKGFNIKEHETVKKGEIIGYVGNTGLSTGPHLHYEVHQHGKQLDPMHYITE